MYKRYSSLFVVLAALLASACQTSQNRSRPEWIDQPGGGTVGSAGMHVRGRHYQEELAIARARSRLAARYGVEVSSVHTLRETVVNERAYVSSTKDTLQQVSRTQVKAQVREIWHDRLRDEIWVWIYPINTE